MSFSLTTPQFKARTKFETMRLGWLFAERGMKVAAVEKSMGRKPGEPLRHLGVIEFLSVERVELRSTTKRNVELEGFPDMTVEQFIAMFCKHMKCGPRTAVTRIRFAYLIGAGFHPITCEHSASAP